MSSLVVPTLFGRRTDAHKEPARGHRTAAFSSAERLLIVALGAAVAVAAGFVTMKIDLPNIITMIKGGPGVQIFF